MTPLPLKQLCARATKGPWKSTGATVRVDSLNKSEQQRICVVTGPSGAAPEAWESINNGRTANAQLIARCSPETLTATYEVLEAARCRIEFLEALSGVDGSTADKTKHKITAVLALLDGQTNPHSA